MTPEPVAMISRKRSCIWLLLDVFNMELSQAANSFETLVLNQLIFYSNNEWECMSDGPMWHK